MSRHAAATSAGRARSTHRSALTPPPRRVSGPAAPPRDGGRPPRDGGRPPRDGGRPPRDGGRPPRASIDASALAFADGLPAHADGATAIAAPAPAARPVFRRGHGEVDRYGREPARHRMALNGPPRLAYGGVAIATRVAGVALDVSGSRMMDRVVRGRVWIGVIAFSLIGLVAMQVSMLKLNAGIGRAAQTVTTLERSNSALRSQITSLSAGDRIQRVATASGLVMPAPGDVAYLRAGNLGEDAARAARRMRPPSPLTVGLAGGATRTGLQDVPAPPGSVTAQVTPAPAPTATTTAPGTGGATATVPATATAEPVTAGPTGSATTGAAIAPTAATTAPATQSTQPATPVAPASGGATPHASTPQATTPTP